MSREGVIALRELGDRVTCSTQRLINSSEAVVSVFQSVEDTVGPHRNDFMDMLIHVKKYVELSKEELDYFSKGVYWTADKIDDFINSGNSMPTPPKRTLKPGR